MLLPEDIAAKAESIVNSPIETDHQHVDNIGPCTRAIADHVASYPAAAK